MKEQECIIMENSKAIEELKKEQDRLVDEKAHLWEIRVWLEEAVFDSCQHVCETTTELDTVEREKQLGAVITQLQ